METIFSLDKLHNVVQQVWQQNKHQKIWLFNAQMGCGKTTFINALCKYLQIIEVPNSPTFSIINEYKSELVGTIYHLDLYRLKDAEANGVNKLNISNLNNGMYFVKISNGKNTTTQKLMIQH